MRVLVALVATLLAMASTAAAQTDSLPGRLLFVKDGDLWIYQSGTASPLGTGGTYSQPAWSPDGASLAYVYRGNNFADIFVTDDRGENQRRLTNSQSTVLENNDWNLRPTWSPDGSVIAFVSDRATTFPVLWAINAEDGSGRRQLITPGLRQDAVDSIAWSPDGTQLAVTLYNEPGPTQIALVPLGTANPRTQSQTLTATQGGALDPAWSPDGSWLAYAGHDGANTEIHVVRPDGSGQQQLTHDGFLARSPVWSPDGRHLAYLSSHSGYFEVWAIDLNVDGNGVWTASRLRELTQELHVDAGSGLSWGP